MEYITIENNTATLAINGELTRDMLPVIRSDFNAAIQRGCTKLIIDLANTTELPSRSFKLFSEFHNRLKHENFLLRNVKNNPKVYAPLYSGNFLSMWNYEE